MLRTEEPIPLLLGKIGLVWMADHDSLFRGKESGKIDHLLSWDSESGRVIC